MAELTARIYAHNGKEERIVYPAADRAASDAGSSEELMRSLRVFLDPSAGGTSVALDDD